jgi:AcrR family transcriptional regulator
MAERGDTYHHGNLKATLLKAAFQVIKKTGVESLTLREIARQAGVSHNAPYRHFASKEDLIAALATDTLHQMTAAVTEVAGEKQVEVRLRSAARAYLNYALKNPARFQLTFHAAFDRESYEEYVAAYTESLALLAGLVPAPDTELASELVWSSIHGISELGLAKRLRHGVREELEALADASVSTLLAGLKNRLPWY